MGVLVLVTLIAAIGSDVLAEDLSSRINLCEAFAGKPLLVVNTASHCGYVNFGETFTLLAQQRVRDPNAHPIFQKLGREAVEALL